jgi:hypothetical protein
MSNTPQKRKHAALVRITARERNDEELNQALAYADKLDAEADLEDKIAGVEPAIAEHADLAQILPVLGRVIRSGGVIKSTEHEWNIAQDKEAHRRGIMLTWRWVRSLHSDYAGQCLDFFAGTRESGPLVHWSSRDGHWRRCQSTGNFGRNWACGGKWTYQPLKSDKAPDGGTPYRNSYVFESLQACNPTLNKAINDIMYPPAVTDSISIAKAKLEAAQLRQRAAAKRQQAMRYRQQASRPIYPGQTEVSTTNAAIADARADQLDALAAVKLAEAGADESQPKPNANQSNNGTQTCNPTPNQNTKNTMDPRTQDDSISIAKAKLEAAQLRQRAAAKRQQAMRYRQQASRPIYPGQMEVSTTNAAIADARADQLDALAAVRLAEAGADESQPNPNANQSRTKSQTCNATLNQTNKNIMDPQTQDDRIRIAKAKFEAAQLRQRAAASRQQAMRYRQQASRPIYPGQTEVSTTNAAIADARAEELEARAELALAEADA